MSQVIQAGAVLGLYTALTISTYVLEQLRMKNLLDIHTSAATVVPLDDHPVPFYVRRDRNDRQRNIKVFGNDGVQLYTIERLSAINPIWNMLTFPERREVATINSGVFSSSVDFHTKSGISHRDISVDYGLGGGNRSFYTNDGAKYTWARGSKFLEKVINPNGGAEEIRERVAKVKLMRQFKFDFEVLVNESKIDREIALATAFSSMLTQWGVGEITDTVGPTFIEPKKQVDADTNKFVISKENDSSELVLMIDNNHSFVKLPASDSSRIAELE
ncbi:uncharacterized protein AC631_00050 [Debaryomyces fabryi]|uniref:Uncharacterized protein n=1 Tax=Debaryomyces fabryi TaxID=58627 RepID=A0A0V1Q6R4_9ASCO|nr:uncharacterized protein AC631_00050 [Debaryomyces fabryi]KSA04179.1 hypothetical protein AC631_00050 [Debaryomyces fabryi]CUM46236.1 unnamed protein product [Debaryomyces fabryi]